jgi:4,5-dihydroxyphthalate decarboxylase
MPLIPNAVEAGLRALRERGHNPINHMIVIKDELLAVHPDLAADVFNVFAESKLLYVDRLKGGKIEKLTAVDKVHQRVMEITGEPLRYGIEPNRRIIEDLIQHALTQGIISRPVTVEELFARDTHGVVA